MNNEIDNYREALFDENDGYVIINNHPNRKCKSLHLISIKFNKLKNTLNVTKSKKKFVPKNIDNVHKFKSYRIEYHEVQLNAAHGWHVEMWLEHLVCNCDLPYFQLNRVQNLRCLEIVIQLLKIH